MILKHMMIIATIPSIYHQQLISQVSFKNFSYPLTNCHSKLNSKLLNLFPEHPYENLFKGISPVLLYFASVCCVLFMLLGIPGNLCTIIALARCKKVRKSLKLRDFQRAASTFFINNWNIYPCKSRAINIQEQLT